MASHYKQKRAKQNVRLMDSSKNRVVNPEATLIRATKEK